MGASGLTVTAGATTIRNLVINGFLAAANGTGGNGIVLMTRGGDRVRIRADILLPDTIEGGSPLTLKQYGLASRAPGPT